MEIINKYCIKCNCALTSENWNEYAKKNYINKCKNCLKEEKKIQARKKYSENSILLKERNIKYKKRLLKENPKKYKCQQMYNSAKKRAKEKGLEFDISSEFLYSIAPDKCPILDKEIKYQCNSKDKYSASLDRIDSSKGYTKDNVQIISYLANLMKNNSTIEEQIKFAKYILKKYMV